jgi:hypothetical protein
MIKQFVSSLLCVTLLSNVAYAQTVDVTEKSVISPLNEGMTSPFTGLLLSPQAVATIIAERESYEPRCQIKIDKSVAENQSKCDFNFAEAKTTYDAEDEIDNRPSKIVWTAVGFGGGVMITLLSVFVVSKLSN